MNLFDWPYNALLALAALPLAALVKATLYSHFLKWQYRQMLLVTMSGAVGCLLLGGLLSVGYDIVFVGLIAGPNGYGALRDAKPGLLGGAVILVLVCWEAAFIHARFSDVKEARLWKSVGLGNAVAFFIVGLPLCLGLFLYRSGEFVSNDAYSEGNRYRYNWQFKEAVGRYNEAVRIRPWWSEAFFWRGYCYENLGELQKAIDDYNHAVMLRPDDSLAYEGRGHYLARADAYNKLELYPKAMDDWSKGIDCCKIAMDDCSRDMDQYSKLETDSDPVRRQYLSQCLLERKDEFNKVIALAAAAYAGRANQYEKLGKRDLAAKDRQKANDFRSKSAQK